jgi:hypothetical protein
MHPRTFILGSLILGMILGACTMFPPQTEGGVLDASWTEPTTNVDGTALVDMATYRVYFTASPGVPCPGSTFVAVAAPKPTPDPNSRVSKHLTGLTVGKAYVVAVTAVNVDGVESACSATANASARPSTPAATSAPTLQ